MKGNIGTNYYQNIQPQNQHQQQIFETKIQT